MESHDKRVLMGIQGIVKTFVAITISLLISTAPTAFAMGDRVPADYLPPMKDQSFLGQEVWTEGFWGGWTYWYSSVLAGTEVFEYPRMLADVNGDGKQDMVGFHATGVWLGLSTGSAFYVTLALPGQYNAERGWDSRSHVRLVGDINGDKMDDIVGFGGNGVYTSLSTGSGFAPGKDVPVVYDFGYDQSWRVDKHVRLLADVNGDGRKDIVGFGGEGVRVAFATPDGNFAEPFWAIHDFGYDQGWRPDRHIRTTADVNGDGKQDIVGFGDDGVMVALSTGNGFTFVTPQPVLANFSPNAGSWKVNIHPRVLVDVNRDGKSDIVGFGGDSVYVSYSTGNGFTEAQPVSYDYVENKGWVHYPLGSSYKDENEIRHDPVFVTDLNGDGYMDIVGYQVGGVVFRSLGGPNGFDTKRSISTYQYPDERPHFVADVTGDGLPDLIDIVGGRLVIHRSSTQPPPQPQ